MKNLPERIGEFIGAGVMIAIGFMVVALILKLTLFILGVGG